MSSRLNQLAQQIPYKNGLVDVWDPWKMSRLSPKGSSIAICLGNTHTCIYCIYNMNNCMYNIEPLNTIAAC